MTGLRGERGTAVIELAIVTPAVILLLMFVVAAGRLAQARTDVYGAAADAARALSVRQEPADATSDARRSAERALSDRPTSCRRLDVGVDTSGLHPGGTVAARVTCTVRLSDLGLLGLPGTRDVSATAHEVVDRYRGS